MRQLALHPSTGALAIVDAPSPEAAPGQIRVRTAFSLISTGTELSKVDLASKPLWEKAHERPDQVRQVLDSIRTEGIVATAQKVQQRLAAPQPLGYSLSGTVIGLGPDCPEFQIGARVACGGASACHAEIVAVPTNLAVAVPEEVPLQDASFATIASIALHGLRTGGVVIGDRVLVIGLGLIGQLAARLGAAAGAHVFGVDPRNDRVSLALEFGAEAAETRVDSAAARQVLDWSGGRGADVILITAGGAEAGPLLLAGAAARDRARVVVVGNVELNVPREPFYRKELSLVVSRSYGPGRYDIGYEEKGLPYPVGFVPWTERRNMEEVLDLIASGKLSLAGLREERVPFERASEAYALLGGESGPSPVSVVLEYPRPVDSAAVRHAGPDLDAEAAGPSAEALSFPPRRLNVSFIGMGNFAMSHLLPAVKKVAGVSLVHVVTASPLKAESARSRGGFGQAGTSAAPALADPGTDVVFIATRHDSHARYAEAALLASKAVFVEKPLALSRAELDRVSVVQRATQGRLMIGFNRRFAPATLWALASLGTDRAGLRFHCRVNAGPLPDSHWLLDPEIGGGRLLGEVCHFLDLACLVAASAPASVEARALDHRRRGAGEQDFHVEVAFANGATAGIEYLAGGDPALPKERIEIHRSGTSVMIDDFRSAEIYRSGKRRVKRWPTRDKGHRRQVRAFLEAVRDGSRTPIAEEESLVSTALTLAAARSVREGRTLRRDEW